MQPGKDNVRQVLVRKLTVEADELHEELNLGNGRELLAERRVGRLVVSLCLGSKQNQAAIFALAIEDEYAPILAFAILCQEFFPDTLFPDIPKIHPGIGFYECFQLCAGGFPPDRYTTSHSEWCEKILAGRAMC